MKNAGLEDGGNVTGMEFQGQETMGKQLELLHLMSPGIKRIALIRTLREDRMTDALVANLQAAATIRGVTVVPVRTDLAPRWPHPARRQAGRPADRAADPLRRGHQPETREGDRIDHPAGGALAGDAGN